MNTIFLVEDDPLLSKLYRKAFEMEGCSVSFVFDGEEALKELSTLEPSPDVVLLDVMIPKINGIEVLRQIKKDPKLKEIPVIMLTNLSREDEEKEAMEIGAYSYLIKDEYSPKEILEKAREAIGGNAPNF